MRVFLSVKDTKLRAAASISCALLGLIMLSRILMGSKFDDLDVINAVVFLALGGIFSIASAWLDKRPVLETTDSYLIVRRGVFTKKLTRNRIKEVTSTQKHLHIFLVSRNGPIKMKSLSISASECSVLIRRWLDAHK